MKKILFVILLSFVCFCCKGQNFANYEEVIKEFNVNKDTLIKINICPDSKKVFHHLIIYYEETPDLEVYEELNEIAFYFSGRYNSTIIYPQVPKGYQSCATGLVYKDKENNYYFFVNGKCHAVIKENYTLKIPWYNDGVLVYTNELPTSKKLGI